MNIGVPRGDQRNTGITSGQRTQNADVTGPGDVDEVSPELLQMPGNSTSVAEEQKVESQVCFERNSGPARLQLKRLLVGLCQKAVFGPGTYDQERQVPALRECFELPARVRDTVYFVIGIGEEGDARRREDIRKLPSMRTGTDGVFRSR